MKIIITSLLLIFLGNAVLAQNTIETKGQHGVYGGIVSVPFFVIPVPKGIDVGYEYHFGNKFPSTNLRIGIEYKKLDGNYYNLTAAYNFLLGKNKNYFEAGINLHLGHFQNETNTITQETFEVATYFSRVGINLNYVRVLFVDTKILLRIGLNLLSRDFHLKTIKNDYINQPGDGDQVIQPYIYIGMTKMFG